jgi:putative transporter
MLFSFLIPWIGAAALSPYKFSLLSSETNNISYTYIADDLILMKLSLYFVYIILMLLISRRIFKRKDGEQPCL